MIQRYTCINNPMHGFAMMDRQKLGGYVKYADYLQEVEKLRDCLREIREIYAGMDGLVPETAPEAYQQRIIKQMYNKAIRGLKGKGHGG